jgi:hypothetical protein
MQELSFSASPELAMPKPQPEPRSLVSTLADYFPLDSKVKPTLAAKYPIMLFVGPPAGGICRMTARTRFIHLN